MQPIIQPTFAAGELSPSLYARVDLAKYHAGAALLRNFQVNYWGGASNRPGTAYLGRVIDSTTQNRLIPFSFNTQQTYALLFGNQTLRFISNGGFVLETSFAISMLTTSNPGVFTATGHNFNNGDTVFLQGLAGPTSLNNKFYLVTGVAGGTFELTDLDGNVISTIGLPAYVSGGTVARVYTIATPYLSTDLPLLKFTQSADVMTLTHNSYAPQQLQRLGATNWTMTAITYSPSTPAPTGVTATPSITTGTTQYTYVVTAVGARGTESRPSAVANSGNSATMSQTLGARVSVAWSAVAGATLYNIYRQAETIGTVTGSGNQYGFVGTSTSLQFYDQDISPDFANGPPQANNPFAGSNNPACSTYYQQRQAFAGLVNAPDGIVLSKTGDFLNMDYSTPVEDNDSIQANLISLQVNQIKHLVPMQSLIALTSSGAWRIDGGTQSDAVTPTSILAVPQTYNGCSDVPPIIVGFDILYVQARGSIVRDLNYNFYVNVYTGEDKSVLANHLFFGHQILEWAYAEEPFKIIWCVREDGILLSFTYLKEQDVYAWAHHDTQGLFKSVCTVIEGSENAVYVIVERFINGEYLQFVERFASRKIGGDPTIGVPADLTKCFFVDAGLQYPLGTPNATLTPVAESASPQIAGCNIIAGGSSYTAPVVQISDSTGSGAAITLSLTGGVVTGATVTSPGGNYTNPTLSVIDPTGSGAVLGAVLESLVTMNASAAVFSGGDIGNVVRINNGTGTVVAVPSSTQITVNVSQALTNLWPAPPGSWTYTAPTSVVTGLDHLDGQMVAILADGNVQAQQQVVNGQITLAQPATAIVAGLPYTSQLTSLYLDVEGGGTIQSKRVKVNAVTVRMQDTRGLAVGWGNDYANMSFIKDRGNQPMGVATPLYTGDHRVNIPPKWQTPAQVCVQQVDPLPCTILGLIPEITVGDTYSQVPGG